MQVKNHSVDHHSTKPMAPLKDLAGQLGKTFEENTIGRLSINLKITLSLASRLRLAYFKKFTNNLIDLNQVNLQGDLDSVLIGRRN